MHAIYAGDASDVRKRIRQHARGNVEASILRRRLAEGMGLAVTRTRRSSGSWRIRLDPAAAEAEVTRYLAEGWWRVVACASKEEARDFQWYAIRRLQPLLNREAPAWDSTNDVRYGTLLAGLLDAEAKPTDRVEVGAAVPGVYVLYHAHLPGGPSAE